MNNPILKTEKKDEGVKVTLSLNNEMLAQMISKGIQDLPKEVIHTLSYEAVKSALQDKEFLKHLMFWSGSNNTYDWWEHAQLQPWLAELLQKSFTDEEVKEFRDGVLKVLKTDHKSIAVEALTSAFMKKLSDFDFDSQVRCIVSQNTERGIQPMSDTVTNPLPWHTIRALGSREEALKVIVADRDYSAVAQFEPEDEAAANLVVDAVNERDRLRDIVRRLLPLAETTVENIRALGTARFPFMEQIKSDRLRGDINREVAHADYLLREARAAIGEGEK